MSGKNLDQPDEFERRAIDRHPLTQRLNRELLESFRRNSRLASRNDVEQAIRKSKA